MPFRPFHSYSRVLGSTLTHGGVPGLSADDHTQYLLVDGSRGLTGNWAAGSFAISSAGLSAATVRAAGVLALSGDTSVKFTTSGVGENIDVSGVSWVYWESPNTSSAAANPIRGAYNGTHGQLLTITNKWKPTSRTISITTRDNLSNTWFVGDDPTTGFVLTGNNTASRLTLERHESVTFIYNGAGANTGRGWILVARTDTAA